MKRPRVLLADDHRIVAEGLKSLLEAEFELVGMVEDGRALVEAARSLRPDVIVADIAMPHMGALEALAENSNKIGRICQNHGQQNDDLSPSSPDSRSRSFSSTSCRTYSKP